jgi:hypothetical protein
MIILYECEFCDFRSEDKENTIKHEKQCGYNPEIKHCYTCKNRINCFDFYPCYYRKTSKEISNCNEWKGFEET